MPWVNDLVSGIPKPIIQNGVINVPDSLALGSNLMMKWLKNICANRNTFTYNPGLFKPTPEFDKPMTMIEAKEKGLIGEYQAGQAVHGGIIMMKGSMQTRQALIKVT